MDDVSLCPPEIDTGIGPLVCSHHCSRIALVFLLGDPEKIPCPLPRVWYSWISIHCTEIPNCIRWDNAAITPAWSRKTPGRRYCSVLQDIVFCHRVSHAASPGHPPWAQINRRLLELMGFWLILHKLVGVTGHAGNVFCHPGPATKHTHCTAPVEQSWHITNLLQNDPCSLPAAPVKRIGTMVGAELTMEMQWLRVPVVHGRHRIHPI